MRRSFRRLFGVLGLLATLVALPGLTAASPAGHTVASALRHVSASSVADEGNTLTIQTSAYMMAGLTPSTMGEGGSGTVSSWYRYYHTLWKQRFPHLKIHEIFVDTKTYDTKALLSISAGNPPDLIGTTNLGLLVARHAVMNLDAFYKRAGITCGDFVPAMCAMAHYNGHWYAMPAASGPSYENVFYFPKWVKAAGWDPNNVPTTWNGLWAATQKVTKWDSKGNLVRIGIPVGLQSGNNNVETNLFCGSFAVYDPKTTRFHANSPCIKAYFRYELRLLKFYGGVAKYTKFASADPYVWSCSNKAYYVTGKIIFGLDAYWAGGQVDTCPNYRPGEWRLIEAPTQDGTASELRGVTSGAWTVMIPTGAKHPQLAFDFIKFTCWDHGYLEGPTTNGFVTSGQGEQWASFFDQNEAAIRAKNHMPGNPIAAALKVVSRDGQIGQGFEPNDEADNYYGQQMSHAWQEVEYGRMSIDQALDQAQRLVDFKQKIMHAQAGL